MIGAVKNRRRNCKEKANEVELRKTSGDEEKVEEDGKGS